MWTPVLGDVLACQVEFGNIHDVYAVAVLSGGTVVGHVPRNISAVCYLFIRRIGTIVCQVTGNRRYSSDLVQGGLEIPCRYTFSCEDNAKLDQVRLRLEKAPVLSQVSNPSSSSQPPASKKAKMIDLSKDYEKSLRKYGFHSLVDTF